MPNEPCGNSVCVDRAELEALRKAAAERDQWRAAERRAEDGCNELMGLLHKAETERDELKSELDLNTKLLAGVVQERDSAVAAAKERDAVLAEMRGVLEAIELSVKQGHSPFLVGWSRNEYMAQIEKTLSTDFGAATLEYIRGLEKDNEKAKGLLREIQREIEFCPGCDPETDVRGCESPPCELVVRYLRVAALLKRGGKDA